MIIEIRNSNDTIQKVSVADHEQILIWNNTQTVCRRVSPAELDMAISHYLHAKEMLK